MNSYFIWDGSPEIFTLGTLSLPFGISIPGLLLAVALYFFGRRYLEQRNAPKSGGRKRRRQQENTPETGGWLFAGLLAGSFIVGQLVALPFGGPAIHELGPVSVRWYGMLF